MKHRGEIVKTRILEKGIKITVLAKDLGTTTTTMYRQLTNENLGWDKIRKIGEFINHDFGKDFPEMPKAEYNRNNTMLIIEDENAEYNVSNVEELRKMVGYWKGKYMKSIEKLNDVLLSK